MRMDSPTGKQILALVRNGDYAHAGEEESINLVFADVSKDPDRLILDVGCGRGGTANYLQQAGWGVVSGVDVDAESIAYARKTYPEVDFKVADASSLTDTLSKRFDLLYIFNAFYAFSDHSRALSQMYQVCSQGGQLIVSDYAVSAAKREKFLFKDWNPIDPAGVSVLFAGAGWQVSEVKDLSGYYRKWYSELVAKIDSKAKDICALADEEWFKYVRNYYRTQLNTIETGVLGGATVYAIRK